MQTHTCSQISLNDSSLGRDIVPFDFKGKQCANFPMEVEFLYFFPPLFPLPLPLLFFLSYCEVEVLSLLIAYIPL